MGLFSRKTTVHVASTLYNLAGPEEDRPNYLKTSVYSSLMSSGSPYLGEHITNTHFKGPAMQQRSFFNWSKRTRYAGLPAGSINNSVDVDLDIVAAEIVPPAGQEVLMQNASSESADFGLFTEKWVLENRPDKSTDDYTSDFYNGDITVQYTDGTTDTFTPVGYNPDSRYLVYRYLFQIPDRLDPPVHISFSSGLSAKPITVGRTLENTVNDGNQTLQLRTETVSVATDSSDGSVTTTTVLSDVTNVDWDIPKQTYSKHIYIDTNGSYDQVRNSEYQYIWQKKKLQANVLSENTTVSGTVTTEETVTQYVMVNDWEELREDQTEYLGEIQGTLKMGLYEFGANVTPVYEQFAFEDNTAGTEEFFPSIPIRINNTSINDHWYDDEEKGGNKLRSESLKAYRKATNGESYSKLIDIVEDNESLGDIDYAFMTYGVPLNVKDQASKKYIYTFLKNLAEAQTVQTADFNNFQNQLNDYYDQQAEMNAWLAGQHDENSIHYGTARPATPRPVNPKTTALDIRSTDPRMSHIFTRLNWAMIDETFHIGVFEKDDGELLKKNEVHIQPGGQTTWTTRTELSGRAEGDYTTQTHIIEHTDIIWQTADNRYKKLVVAGLIHQNFIYGANAVSTDAADALSDEDPSSLLLPMHMPSMRELNLIDRTQMTTANTYVVFNSYKLVKQKWYQTGIFKIIMVIIAIIIIVYTGGAAAGAAGGILGSNAAVGAAIGLTGAVATLVGAIANAIVGMIVSNIISKAATELLGDEIGGIIGAIVSFFVMSGFSQGFGNGFNIDWTQLTSAKGLLKLSSVLANGYSGMINAETMEIGMEMAEKQSEYEEQMEKLNEMIKELSDNNGLNFNPMQLTDVYDGNKSQRTGSYMPETSDEFIRRTTMTGSDIVNITLSMVYDYTKLSLTLPKN